MSLKIQTLMQIIEAFAPKRLAEDWDNVGLLLGDPSAEVKRILIALDVDENVLEEAISRSCDMIITHHPMIFKPLKAIREDLPTGKIIAKLIRHKIAVYSAHTNLDAADGGVNDILAALLELEDIEPLSRDKEEKLLKITVFVPHEHLDKVRGAMAVAGAGYIGNYSNCFFAVSGEGTFLPLEGSKPYIGSKGNFEKVQEYRLETIVPASSLKKVVNAMIKAHPYEEIAYDIISLENEGVKTGIGRIGYLAHPMSLEDVANKIKNVLGISKVKVAGNPEKLITKIAVVGGSGAPYIGLAAFSGAECLITGDVKYHEAQEALQRNINLIDAGHYETEVPALAYLAAKITHALADINKHADIIISTTQNAPFVFM